MESSKVMLKQKLGFFGILKEALLIPCRNINFIIFTSLASLPLFCFLVIYEQLLQRTLLGILGVLTEQHLGSYENYVFLALHISSNIFERWSRELIQLGLLYLFPLQILKLFTAALAIDLASNAYQERKAISLLTLRNSASNIINKTRFKGIALTSACVLLLSMCSFVASFWLATIYYIIMRGIMYNMFSAALFRAICMALLGKCMEWSTVWNMGIVASVSEGVNGADALMLSTYYSSGAEKQGLLLMLVFFVWEQGSRVLCLYAKYKSRGSGILALVSMLCLGNVMKWVACVVYYHNCKNQISDKRVDEEMARGGKPATEHALDV